MGRAQGDGYSLDSPPPPSSSSFTSSPQHRGANPVVSLPTREKTSRPSPSSGNTRKTSETRRDGERAHRHRRHKDTGCRNPQVRKGIGSCVFVLGIPCLIAGLILTIVSASEDDGESRKYPSTFPVLGPVLLALSVVCFVIGVLLYNIAILDSIRDCLGLSDKDSFCRRRFPRLSAWIKPDPTVARNKTAISNLQTAPARSALRKMPNPDLVTMETELKDFQGRLPPRNPGNDLQNGPAARRKRGVTFSGGGDSFDGGFVGVRLNSVSSEADRASMQSENGGGSNANGNSPSSSLLSLRNFRIHPKDEVFWTESSLAGGEGTEGGADEVFEGEGEAERGVHSKVCDNVRPLSEDGGGKRGEGRGGVSLTNIEEEGV